MTKVIGQKNFNYIQTRNLLPMHKCATNYKGTKKKIALPKCKKNLS